MTVRIPIRGALLAWAQQRSGVSRDKLLAKFPALDAWEGGTKQPTLKQLEQFTRVAAEFLLPLDRLGHVNLDGTYLTDELERVAREYKVSTLVVLRRIFDAGNLGEAEYRIAYAKERDRVLELMKERRASGGDFYNTQSLRVSRRFARALIGSTLEGQTLHRDAFQMLGFTPNRVVWVEVAAGSPA